MQPGSGASITKATGWSPRIGLGAGQPPLNFSPRSILEHRKRWDQCSLGAES